MGLVGVGWSVRLGLEGHGASAGAGTVRCVETGRGKSVRQGLVRVATLMWRRSLEYHDHRRRIAIVRILIVHPGPDFSVNDVCVGWTEGLREAGVEVAVFNFNDRLVFYSRALM